MWLKLDIIIHVQAFPVEFYSSLIKNYTTGIIYHLMHGIL